MDEKGGPRLHQDEQTARARPNTHRMVEQGKQKTIHSIPQPGPTRLVPPPRSVHSAPTHFFLGPQCMVPPPKRPLPPRHIRAKPSGALLCVGPSKSWMLRAPSLLPGRGDETYGTGDVKLATNQPQVAKKGLPPYLDFGRA